MNFVPDAFFKTPPFSTPQAEKERLFLAAMNGLIAYHREHCSEFDRIASKMHPGFVSASLLDEVPFLPVGLFKTLELKSIPQDTVFKVLKSSGTTSDQTSHIYLDRETAALQTKTLAHVMSFAFGGKRLPMLIIDAPNIITDRRSFSARGAGILGMMNFGRDHLYALREDMSLDVEGIARWLEKHREEPIFLFGFTFIIWKHFVQQLEKNRLDLSRSFLVHGGGWKKLKESRVSNPDFKAALRASCNIPRVMDYYGMVEQVGSIFVECSEGYLHVPEFSHFICRDPETWKPLPPGKTGIIQVLSTLPGSYPGFSILTEDMGTLHGTDDCACGWRGQYVSIQGRVPKAIARGCSDTFTSPSSAGNSTA